MTANPIQRTRSPLQRLVLWILCLALVVLPACESGVPDQGIVINASAGPSIHSQYDTGVSPSGRIISIALASDGMRVYAAAPWGGLWRSDNGGVAWHQLVWDQPGDGQPSCPPVTCSLPNLNINQVVVSPTNPDLVFAALGGDTYTSWRNGIYRSADGGSHWKRVFQFSCVDGNTHSASSNNQGVDQIVFAPDDPTQLWAAGGCGIAYSAKDAVNPGSAWTLVRMPSNDIVYHVAVAPPQSANGLSTKIRAVYACDPSGNLYISSDGGRSYAQDHYAPLSQGDCPATTSRQSSDIMAIDPLSPTTLFVATGGKLYASVHVFDFSGSGVGSIDSWAVTPAPLSGGWGSGSQFVMIVRAKDNTSRLFYSDGTGTYVRSMQVAGGENGGNWYSLDLNKVHVDPHALALSADFSLQVTYTGALSSCAGGFLLVGNDGGLYRSTDCGQHWQLGQGLQTLAAYYVAGIPGGSTRAALYLSTYDNDAWFSSGGGLDWSEHSYCGDCPPVYTDPALPTVALMMDRQDGPNLLYNVYGISGARPDLAHRDPRDPANKANVAPLTYPAVVEAWRNAHPEVFQLGFDKSNYFLGYRPEVLTMPGERAILNGDYVLVAPTNPSTANVSNPQMGVWRFIGWGEPYIPGQLPGRWVLDGPGLPPGATVVQASGGHTDPAYYVASRIKNDDESLGKNLYRSYRNPTTHKVEGWDCIVPGALHPGSHDGQCVAPPASSGDNDPPIRAVRFTANPYDNAEVYVVDELGRIKLSVSRGQYWTKDGSLTNWMTANGQIKPDCTSDHYCAPDWGLAPSVLEFSSMEFTQLEPETRFAVGAAGVFYTLDTKTWHRALSPDALACYPRRAFFDPTYLRTLFVACEGRSILTFVNIPKR